MLNKNIKIENFHLIDYNTLLKVVAKYVELYQISREKLEWEKDMFDLTNTIYGLTYFKNAVKIEIDNHWKPFWVKVKESNTQYTFEVWYTN